MDYAIYLSEKMDINRRDKYYHDLLILKDISKSLPDDMGEYLHFTYKYDTIEKRTKEHYKYQVLRELRVKQYYSKYMYKYYLELYDSKKKKSSTYDTEKSITVITNAIETRER